MAFQLFDGVVGVVTQDADVTSRVERLIPAYATPLTTTSTDELLCLSRSDRSWVVERRESHSEDYASLDEALEALEHLVAVRLLTLSSHLAHVHAAGAVVNGMAVLALGESGAGKTSVAIQWNRSSHPVLGDDIVLLDEAARAVAFKRLFRVPGRMLSRSEHASDLSQPLHSGPEKFWYDPSRDGAWAAPAPIGVLAQVRYVAEAQTSIRSLTKLEALNLLRGGLMRTGSPTERCFDTLAQISRRARSVHITFGDAAHAAKKLAELT